MQELAEKLNQLLKEIAPSGNLFLLLVTHELRREGLSLLAFYVLQRVIEEPEISESWICAETGFKDYEVSRAIRYVKQTGLVDVVKSTEDARVRLLKITPLGIRIHKRVLSAAAKPLVRGIPTAGRQRRVKEATELFRKANRKLLGPLQLSIFDKDLIAVKPRPVRKARKSMKKS